MKRPRLALAALAVTVGATLAISAAPAQAAGCTASFHVVKPDRIGRLVLPAGIYQLRTTNLTCSAASSLFSEFLEDFDGVLPRPWSYVVQGVGRGRFSRGNASFIAVRVRSAPRPGPASRGGGSHADLRCSGFFRVNHNDRIGALRLPAGRYQIDVLGGRLSCSSAGALFRQFLDDPDGNIGGGWVILARSGEFIRGTSHYGFRVKPLPVQ